MKQSTKKKILNEVRCYLAKHNLNLQTIKTKNPLPCSARWIDSLVQSVKKEDNRNFNQKKCIEVLEFLGISWKLEDGELCLEK